MVRLPPTGRVGTSTLKSVRSLGPRTPLMLPKLAAAGQTAPPAAVQPTKPVCTSSCEPVPPERKKSSRRAPSAADGPLLATVIV